MGPSQELVELSFFVQKLEGFSDQSENVTGSPRLHHVSVYQVFVDALDEVTGIGVAGHDDSDVVIVAGFELFEQLGAEHLGHSLIRQDDIDVFISEDAECFTRVFASKYVVIRTQEVLEGDEIARLIVDDENIGFLGLQRLAFLIFRSIEFVVRNFNLHGTLSLSCGLAMGVCADLPEFQR